MEPAEEAVWQLAIQGLSQSAIARRLHVPRTNVQRILLKLETYGHIERVDPAHRGRASTYRTARQVGGQVGIQRGSPPPPEAPTIYAKWAQFIVPVFKDELEFLDGYGHKHTWTLGMWSGEYRDVVWKGGNGHFYVFTEEYGTWAYYPLKTPRQVRIPGAKRMREKVAVVMLYPPPHPATPQEAVHAETTLFGYAVEFMRRIARDRNLKLRGVPVQVRDAEWAILLEDNPTIPPGRTIVSPGIVVDHSGPGGTPEVQSNQGWRMAQMSVVLPWLQAVPDLPQRLETLERKVDRILALLEDSQHR